jgi:two-component system sensor histidine kinase UhpB
MLIEHLPAIFYIWDTSPGFDEISEQYVSPQIEAITGYGPEEWVANPRLWFESLHPDDRDAVIAETARCAEAGEPFHMEYRMVAKDGRVVWLRDEASVLRPEPSGGVIRYLGVQLDITARKEAEEEQRRAQEQVRVLDEERRRLSIAVLTHEEERRQIASSVFDETLQALFSQALRLGTLGRDHPDLQEDEAFSILQADIARSIARLRDLMFELHPFPLESVGVADALRSYLKKLGRAGGIEYRLESSLRWEPSRETRSVMFSIAREALANARAHGHPSRVTVVLEDRAGGFLTAIVDDGSGFDVSSRETSSPGHVGLDYMRQRAEASGGWWRIHSTPGAGTKVEYWLPDRG